MKSISISRAKTFKNCKLLYDYTYEHKVVPVKEETIAVTSKGLALHETFESLLKFENYNGKEPNKGPLRQVTPEYAKAELDKFIKKNGLEGPDLASYNMDLGLQRWLSFKHDYLDKRGHTLYAEKEYNEVLFGETKTITILDLLEDCGDGNFIIYDYKTPASIDSERYKTQLVTYAYMMAIVKGIIPLNSEDYEEVAKRFKLYVFYPLATGKWTTYEKSLDECTFTAEDVKAAIEDLKNTASEIDAFDFSKPAEALQPCKIGFECKWCKYAGSEPQAGLVFEDGKKFEGCPLTRFAGFMALNEEFKRP